MGWILGRVVLAFSIATAQSVLLAGRGLAADNTTTAGTSGVGVSAADAISERISRTWNPHCDRLNGEWPKIRVLVNIDASGMIVGQLRTSAEDAREGSPLHLASDYAKEALLNAQPFVTEGQKPAPGPIALTFNYASVCSAFEPRRGK